MICDESALFSETIFSKLCFLSFKPIIWKYSLTTTNLIAVSSWSTFAIFNLCEFVSLKYLSTLKLFIPRWIFFQFFPFPRKIINNIYVHFNSLFFSKSEWNRFCLCFVWILFFCLFNKIEQLQNCLPLKERKI